MRGKRWVAGFLSLLLLAVAVPEIALAEEQEAGTVTVSFEDYGIRRESELDDANMIFPSQMEMILGPEEIPFYEGDTIAEVTLRYLEDNGLEATYTGTPTSSFYLSAIGTFYSEAAGEEEMFGEFSAGVNSGWMITLNEWFINQGASEFEVENGDVIRWQYTCQLGADIGCDWDNSVATIAGLDLIEGYGTLVPAFSEDVRDYTLAVQPNLSAVKVNAILENYWSIVTYSVGDETYGYKEDIPVEAGDTIVVRSSFSEYYDDPDPSSTDEVRITVRYLGDVNQDDHVNSRDIVAIQKAIVSGNAIEEPERTLADVNDDGHVNSRDIVAIQKYIVGNITEF
ncbi:MAG TPA: dockerin type I domain-containing protein [Oscillospiraceae bacterium]|nr:dockerin type I domain-containing protein [Oscillospiraceae bacterium]HXK78312.1 dockerin type I domain-containing protein [Oscillospiraceae bacterium]